MAVVARRRKKTDSTGLKMNSIFFGMSLVMLIVMAISMWTDTHPEWRSYQERFAAIERKVLLAQEADLIRQIKHPDYLGDYKKAKTRYTAAKGEFDKASSALDQTEADLEEMELQAKAGQGEEGAADESASAGGGGTPKPATNTKASAAELAELDKEFQGDKGKTPPPVEPQQSESPAKPAASSQPTKAELAEMDKEFQSPNAAKGGNETAPEKAPPSKGQSAPGSGGKGPTGSQPSKDEMAELDKEFQSANAPKGQTETASGGGAATEEKGANFEEISFTVDTKGADSRLEAAKRDLLSAEQRHTKEMIALPKEEELQRRLSDARLKEAQQIMAVAVADVALQSEESKVKEAATLASYAQDVQNLGKGGPKGEDADKLKEAQSKLQAHEKDLNRDLRLVEGKLDRNRSQGPEVQQIFVERLGAVDRCTTCHRAVEDPSFASVPQPFTAHPGNMLKWHPVERFGCASCHGGFGSALGKGEAHGDLVGKGKPLMIGDQVQASCGKCHGESKQLPGASTFLAGAQLFRTSGCLGCHKLEGIETPLKAGPMLDRVDEKVSPNWLVAWLKDPRSHSLEARMPNFGLKDEEAKAIAAYLLTQHGSARLDELLPVVPTSAERFAAGKKLVDGLGCLGCHAIRGQGNTVGPELTNIRNKVRPDWLYSWLENPKAYLPNSRMPVFGLTKDQCKLIGDYLLDVGAPKPAPTPFSAAIFSSAAAQTGSKLIAERGCAGCHDIKGFDRIAAPELTHIGDKTADLLEFGTYKPAKKTLYNWIVPKIEKPDSFDTSQIKAKMPKFGLSEMEAKQIGVFLLSTSSDELPPEYTKDARAQDSPLAAGRRIFADHNCAGCHRISGVGAKVGPDLTREGEKVRPDWLFNFLEKPERIRWWQDARMPNFHLASAEATTLTESLMELSNQPAPYDYIPPEQRVYPLADEGAKHFIDLKCQSCHPFGGKQQVGGGDTKKLGPDLALAQKRLKGDWMFRFLKDPQAFDPGTQMPTFKENDQTFHGLVDFLMKPRSP